jgi:CxxC motif-containing protein (DUF1111 family)
MSQLTRALLLFVIFIGASVVAACNETAAPPESAPPPAAPPPAGEVLLAAGPIGSSLRLLTPEQQVLFDIGNAVFQTEFTPETGLGPLFNAAGCANCHEVPVVGGGGSNDPEEEGEDVELHATAFHPGAQCNDLAATGGPVVQQQVTPALFDALHVDAEPVPGGATATGRRTTPDVFGFGLLDAVPDREIEALADPLDRNGDGISGRPNRSADGRIGRFGRKAQSPTLREFNTDAFVMEMGVTNPGNPHEQIVAGEPFAEGIDPLPEPEIGQDQVDAANTFVQFLAPPPREPLDFTGAVGAVVFAKIGCVSCHVPVLLTGPSPIAALRLKLVPAFTDLLVHDMGPELADICLGLAQPAEFRTEPLMGLRFVTAFLHDGRAATVEEAVEMHGGEATRARNRFVRLSRGERAALVRFLKSL